MASSLIGNFFFPSLNKRFFIRLGVIGLVCYIVFGHLLIPLRIKGRSMEPTYGDNSFAFCWRLQYLFSPPKTDDIVTVRYAGRHVMLLKRIVALEGDTVAFHQGALYLNGKIIPEPYVSGPSDWELPARTVAPGHVYIVGDNRSTSMERHRFGQVKTNRIVGGVFP